MTPLTTVAPATRTVSLRVIRSPPLAGSQLERNRAMATSRCILARMMTESASFMQVSDAHLQVHRQNRRRSASASVTRPSATPPRRASSSSESRSRRTVDFKLNVALDIRTKLGELAALQHQASAQHQHPKPKAVSLCLLRTILPRVMTATVQS
jgi:hypothetical protein